MKVPEVFIKEGKEITQEELEEIIKKTLVDKVLVENIAKEVKNYLESETLAKKINISFDKPFKIKGSGLELTTEKEIYPSEYDPEQIRNIIDVKYETKVSIVCRETGRVLEKILCLEPEIKEEEVMQKNNNNFTVLSKNIMYEVYLNYSRTGREYEETGQTEKYTKKNKKIIRRMFRRDYTQEETVDLPVTNIYENFSVYGNVKYIKFNHEHNAKILKALKDMGYNCSVQIKEEKQ